MFFFAKLEYQPLGGFNLGQQMILVGKSRLNPAAKRGNNHHQGRFFLFMIMRTYFQHICTCIFVWLVLWNIFFNDFPYIGNNNPN